MIKKIIFSLFCVMATLPAMAQDGLGANQRVIGHTVSDSYDYEGVAFGDAGTYSVGALLDSSTLEFYKGCKVVGIRVAVAMDLGRTSMFVTDIAGEQLFSQKQRLYKGWNNVFFNGEGYTLTGNESLFYGFDYVETDEMVEAETGGLVCMETATTNGFLINIDNQLYPISGVGDLCVQLIVDISALPKNNLAISFFDTGFKYKKTNEELDIFFMLNNVGRDAITSYSLALEFDDNEPIILPVEKEIPSGAMDSYEKYLPMPANLGIGSHTLTAYVAEVNGQALPEDMRKPQSVTMALYDNSLEREKVYVEVYSDQNNYLSSTLDGLLSTMRGDIGDKMALAQVHAPTTSLAMAENSWLHQAYAYTTPTFTINRAYFPGENHIAYDMNDYLLTWPDYFLVAMMEDMVEQDIYNPAFAGIEIHGDYAPATRQLSLDINGEVLPEAKAIYGDLALTAFLVEDNVVAPQLVIGAGNRPRTNNKYAHNNVVRHYITSAKGDKLTLGDNNYSASYSLELPAEYNPSQMRIIAFLTKAGEPSVPSTLKDYDVINCTDFSLAEISAVEEIETGETAKEIESIYTLDGLRLRDGVIPSSGLYIIRYTDGSSSKVALR